MRVSKQKLTERRFQVDYKKDFSNSQNSPEMEWAFSGGGLLPVPGGLPVWLCHGVESNVRRGP